MENQDNKNENSELARLAREMLDALNASETHVTVFGWMVFILAFIDLCLTLTVYMALAVM